MEKNGRIEKHKTPAEDESGKKALHIIKGEPLYDDLSKKQNSFEKIAKMLHTLDSSNDKEMDTDQSCGT